MTELIETERLYVEELQSIMEVEYVSSYSNAIHYATVMAHFEFD